MYSFIGSISDFRRTSLEQRKGYLCCLMEKQCPHLRRGCDMQEDQMIFRSSFEKDSVVQANTFVSTFDAFKYGHPWMFKKTPDYNFVFECDYFHIRDVSIVSEYDKLGVIATAGDVIYQKSVSDRDIRLPAILTQQMIDDKTLVICKIGFSRA